MWVTGGPDGGYGTICRTTDGGLSWERKGSLGVLPISQIQDVKAVDQDSAWFVNSSTGGHAPEMSVLHTPDNGATWESFMLGTAGDTNGVAAVGDSIVWTACDYSGIFRTDDNGADGFPQQTAAPGSFYLMTIDAEDSDTAWLCGGIHDGTGHHGIIEHTSDGGGTWASQIEVDIELTGISVVKLDENTFTWYLPEGSTDGGMETWILVENPDPDPVTVDLVFDTGSGEVAPPALAGLTVPAESRISCDATSFITTYDLSTRVVAHGSRVNCERATYGNGRAWGTSSTGFPGTAAQWCMAEGATDGGMESWTLIENPNPDPVDVNVRFLTGAGEVAGPTGTLAPHTRSSCRVNDWVNAYDVATEVTASGGVVCERSTYGGEQGDGWAWGTSSAGTPFASAQWYVPGMDTGNGAWILVANPNAAAAAIDVEYYAGQSVIQGPQVTVPLPFPRHPRCEWLRTRRLRVGRDNLERGGGGLRVGRVRARPFLGHLLPCRTRAPTRPLLHRGIHRRWDADLCHSLQPGRHRGRRRLRPLHRHGQNAPARPAGYNRSRPRDLYRGPERLRDFLRRLHPGDRRRNAGRQARDLVPRFGMAHRLRGG